MHNRQISSRIAEAMRFRRVRQSELADLLGTSQSTVSRWLDGRPIPDDKLDEIAAALTISKTWLRTGTGDMNAVPPRPFIPGGPQPLLGPSLVMREDPARYQTRQRGIYGVPLPVVNALTLLCEKLPDEAVQEVADTVKSLATQLHNPDDEEALFSTVTFLRRIKSDLNPAAK